jgi:phosphatidylglycerophosphatase A
MNSLEGPYRFIATFFGTGYAPGAPGTAGTFATLPLYLAIRKLSLTRYLLVILLVTLAGILSAGRMEKLWGKDPSRVVIDEVAGTLVALVSRPSGLREILLGMALFRLFDILKPPPVSTLENLEGGVGIMADDLAAGVLSALALAAVRAAAKPRS